jgi:hypothetical protein
LTSFKPSGSVGWPASSWKRTLTLCRCWSTTAWTWANKFQWVSNASTSCWGNSLTSH